MSTILGAMFLDTPGNDKTIDPDNMADDMRVAEQAWIPSRRVVMEREVLIARHKYP